MKDNDEPKKEEAQLTYEPEQMCIKTMYEVEETLYNERLSPATIYRVRRKSDSQIFTMKLIEKSKLFGDLQLHSARQECAIQTKFNQTNIVKVAEYTENLEEIIIIQEYINSA